MMLEVVLVFSNFLISYNFKSKHFSFLRYFDSAVLVYLIIANANRFDVRQSSLSLDQCLVLFFNSLLCFSWDLLFSICSSLIFIALLTIFSSTFGGNLRYIYEHIPRKSDILSSASDDFRILGARLELDLKTISKMADNASSPLPRRPVSVPLLSRSLCSEYLSSKDFKTRSKTPLVWHILL